MIVVHPLEARLDTAAAAPLHRELVSRLELGRPLLLDGSKVDHSGLACLQLLTAARAAAAEAGLAFGIAEASKPLRDAATLAGLAAVLDPTD
ncbi:STAS domain-containing protein [Sphingomonas sp.]|uniref:STAS domain-containing protein n=1 Tax=Sphingomonas sp. TaxID=28214 RepID=UPI003B009637